MTFKKSKNIFVVMALVILTISPAVVLTSSSSVFADAMPLCTGSQTPQTDNCRAQDTAITCAEQGNCNSLVNKYINPIVKLLSVMVGLVITISIIVGGIQYGSAAGDPAKAVAARKRIFNAIYALIAFILLAAFLQWLIPGGIV